MPKGDFSGREKRLFLAALAFRFGPEGFFCFGGRHGRQDHRTSYP